MFILYRSTLKGIMIPKRFFQNEEQEEEFEKLIARKITHS